MFELLDLDLSRQGAAAPTSAAQQLAAAALYWSGPLPPACETCSADAYSLAESPTQVKFCLLQFEN